VSGCGVRAGVHQLPHSIASSGHGCRISSDSNHRHRSSRGHGGELRQRQQKAQHSKIRSTSHLGAHRSRSRHRLQFIHNHAFRPAYPMNLTVFLLLRLTP
jgi:hypothetical protein